MTKTIIAKELESELMLYDSEQDEVHVLNATARLIYKLYGEGKNLTEIEQAVRKAFQLKENQDIQGDVQKCLEELRKKELFRVHRSRFIGSKVVNPEP